MVSIPELTPASPARPPAAYLGGKKNLARRIIPMLQAIPHATYVEPFVGMGGIFLRRPWRSKGEVINDLNADVANLFRILQRHFPQFMDALKWQITSRAEFERLARAEADTLTDLERAARFLYLQRLSFGGKVVGQNFGVDLGRPGRFDVTRLHAVLEDVHERLAGVIIERLPFEQLLTRYDRPETLFYLDPPYYGCEDDYGAPFTRTQFEAMAEQLATLRGPFLLSLNDHEEVRRIFARFELIPVEVSYGIAGGGQAGRAKELLIRPRAGSQPPLRAR